MAASRLAEILKQEYKSKGLIGGAASAGTKRLREVLDIRNILFSGSGLGSVVGRKIFGRGYTATPDKSKISVGGEPSSLFTQESIQLLSRTAINTTIAAKNSVVLPAMARDMNLVRQNIAKLVKLQGGTAAQRADMFFGRAEERENAYESQFGRASKRIESIVSKLSPSKVGGSDDKVSGIMSLFGTSSFFNLIKLATSVKVIGILTAMAGASVAIMKFFQEGGWLDKIAEDKLPTPEATKPREELSVPEEDMGGRPFIGRSAYDARKKRAQFRIEEQGTSVSPETAKRLKKAYDIDVPESQITKTPEQLSSSLLDIIAKGESGSLGYNAMNQGGNAATGIVGSGSSKDIIGKNLTDMTVGEILQRGKLPMGNSDRIFAAGRYQIIPDTLQGLVKQGVVSETEKFTEEVQDRLGRALIQQSGALKSAQEGNLVEAQNKLAKVWASIPTSTGGSALGGPNKADAKLGEMIQSTLKGQVLTQASNEVSTNREAMQNAPVVVNAPNTVVKQSSQTQQKQSVQLPDTTDPELFNALMERLA